MEINTPPPTSPEDDLRQINAAQQRLNDAIGQRKPPNRKPPNRKPAAQPAARAAAPGEPPPTPTELDLRDRYLKAFPDTAYGLGQFRRCANGLWSPLPLPVLRAEILSVAERSRGQGVRPNSRLISAVVELLRLRTAVHDDSWADRPELFACANGFFNLQHQKLYAHEPHFYCTAAVPYNFDPRAFSSLWNDYLQSTVPEAAAFLQEFAGLALTAHTHFETTLWLHGPGGCGKSTFLHGLQVMLGHRAGSLSLPDLLAGRFSPRDHAGKTLLVCAEQPGQVLTAVQRLNAFVSGETFTIQPRYQHQQQVRPVAKLAWAFTSLPRLTDAHSGLFRRVHVVRFPELSVKCNPQLKPQLNEEGPGLLNWALAGLDRLLERGHFAPPPAVQRASADFRAGDDLPAQFLADRCELDPAQRASAGPLYKAYADWCRANGHHPVNSNQLALDWVRLGLERIRHDGRAYWRGLRLKGLL